MSAPLWLTLPPMQQLLNALVDRLDAEERNGKSSARDFNLNKKTWPAFYDAALETDRENLWFYLEQLVKGGWFKIRPKSRKSKSPLVTYGDEPYLVDLNVQLLRDATGRSERRRSVSEQWRSAVYQHLQVSDDIKQAVCRYCIEIPGETADVVVERLNGIFELAAEPLWLREVSAKLFWKSSKILDDRQEMIATILGLEECPFLPMPVQLQVFLPRQGYTGVLFIENQTTFEQAWRSNDNRFSELALVFAAGFRASAKGLRTRARSSLYFSDEGDDSGAAKDRFKSWFYQDSLMPSWFWGDLDYEGMRILRTLRNSFPDLESWPIGYATMHDALVSGDGHFPEMAGKDLQKKIDCTGCSYADSVLLPSLHKFQKFVDQEMVGSS